MRKLLLALAICLMPSFAFAQNTTCSNRPAGDSSNACANTRFVQQHTPTIGPGNITLPDGQIIIGNGSGVGQGRTMSGDCTITDTGIMTCSSNANYTPPYTGGVTTTVQNKLEQFCPTPQDFGGIAGNTGDQSSALNLWLLAVSSNHICGYWPAGTYRITSALATINNQSFSIHGAV